MIYYGQAAIPTPMRFSTRDEALQEQMESAVRILEKGGVAAIPTDTLYALSACAFNERAVERVFRLKGRPTGVALPLLLADADDIAGCARDIPEVAWALAQRYWPGPLTVVLRKSDAVPYVVTGGMETIALRVPDHWVPRAIARKLGAPITGTSANRSGSRGATSARDVRDDFGDTVDLVVDVGDGSASLPSTVLDLTGKQPRMLRKGAVSQQEIEDVVGEAVAN